MFDQLQYGGYFFAEGVRHVLKIKREIHYDNRLCLDDSHANLWLKEMVCSGKPFMAGRFGSGEMRTFLKTREVRMGLRKTVPEANMDSMCINAGFFPREQGQAVSRWICWLSGGRCPWKTMCFAAMFPVRNGAICRDWSLFLPKRPGR